MSNQSHFELHSVTRSDLKTLSELCLRSKAYWGYDTDFLNACIPALTLTEEDLIGLPIIAAKSQGRFSGVTQLGRKGTDLEIDRLFVDPDFIGKGVGRVLFEWCASQALELGASRLLIEADPGAAPFYERMGARQIGVAPSEVFQDRALPLLELKL